ncbi:FliM/FliN family flagellar motor switch protein [Psychromarinibacter sp. S121]|uniref:FliM/FliN family flagellar motor switch protein n=1 Tax=Psychromarinibacter sp. S121 TaxID=3415127 RepID=UPI003C7C2E27
MTDDSNSLLKDIAAEEIKKADVKTDGQGVNAMLNVSLSVQVVLGEARMPVSQLLSLSRGSVVELDRRIGQPLDVMINDRLVARGDLVKVGEDGLGITLTEIVKDYVMGAH